MDFTKKQLQHKQYILLIKFYHISILQTKINYTSFIHHPPTLCKCYFNTCRIVQDAIKTLIKYF